MRDEIETALAKHPCGAVNMSGDRKASEDIVDAVGGNLAHVNRVLAAWAKVPEKQTIGALIISFSADCMIVD
jgi:hypothetical protein